MNFEQSQFLVRFIAAFIVVYASVWLARNLGSRSAAFVAAFPTITAMSLFFIAEGGGDIQQAAHGSIISTFALLFLVFSYEVLRSFYPQGRIPTVLLTSVGIYSALMIGLSRQASNIDIDIIRFLVCYFLINLAIILIPGNWKAPQPKKSSLPIALLAFLGGGVSVLAFYVAFTIDPLWGGAIGSIPATLLPTLVDIDHRDHYVGVSAFARASSGLLVGPALFAWVFYIAPASWSLFTVFGLGMVAAFIASSAVIYIQRNLKRQQTTHAEIDASENPNS